MESWQDETYLCRPPRLISTSQHEFLLTFELQTLNPKSGGPPCILWFKRCFNDKAEGEICDRTKNAANIWANAWYCSSSRAYTMCASIHFLCLEGLGFIV